MPSLKSKNPLAGLKPVFFVLSVVNHDTYEEMSIAMLKHMLYQREWTGIYISCDKTYSTLSGKFFRAGINPDKLFIIDTVTKGTDIPKDSENAIFVTSPKFLTEISIAIAQVIQRRPEISFIYFDSLTAMLDYNDPRSVYGFVKFLSTTAADLKINGVLLMLDFEKDQEHLPVFQEYVDDVLYVN